MNLLDSENRINELMSRFIAQIKHSNAMSRTDINKIAETILIPLFAKVYGYEHLNNLNYTEENNYPGIDLGDETARVAFQVTSTSNNQKIKDTLEKFVKNKFYEKYDKLIIYILTEKQGHYTGSGHEEIIQGRFHFDKDKDIRDSQDILKEVANLQIKKTCEIESILEENFGEARKAPEREVADKVKQIINENIKFFVGRSEEVKTLNEFLSKNYGVVRLLIAGAGFGKTALLANWVNLLQNQDCFIAYHFFSQRYDITRSVKNAYRHLLQQLYIYYDELIYQQLPNDEQQLREALYYLLREHGARKDKPLVIILDSLDEAENPFESPFPTPLPENVFVIASARAEEGEQPEYLNGWIDSGEPIFLNRLPREAIADWLKQAGEGELAIFADDIHFVKQLDEITQGFPLYLKYLTDDLIHTAKQGNDVREILAQTPKGFEKYVKQQLKRLDQLELPDQRWKFFALLAVAKGTLEKEDVKALTEMRDRHLRQLQQCWQVTRWMKIAENKLYAFAHPLLGKTFANELGDEAEDALEALINYCSRWQDNQSRYGLRHYAEHLRDEKQWEDLYAIARNKTFASCQQENLPDEPDLPLKTIQIALLGAAEEDKAGEMAEFLLAHARQLVQTTSQESPLDALHKGSLDRALVMADLYEIERCVLWYLLLAWELKDTSKLEEAQATLERLQQKELPCFDILGDGDWQCDFAVYFLAHDFEISDSICEVLEQKLLNDRYRRFLSIYLSDFDRFTAAIDTTLKISSDIQIIWQLASIAKVQGQKGDIRAAATFDKALEITRKHFPSHDWFDAMIMIGETQGKIGHQEAMLATFTEAYDLAKTINNSSEPNLQLEDLERKIATIKTGEEISTEVIESDANDNEYNIDDRLLQLKDRLNTSEVLNTESDKNELLFEIAALHSDKQQYNEALEYAGRINNPNRRAKIQGIIAQEQAKSSPTLTARTTFATALQMAQEYEQYESAFLQASALAGVAEVQLKATSKQIAANTASIAHQIALSIHNLWQQATTLARVAEVLVKVEKEDEAKEIFNHAIQTAHKIEWQSERVHSFRYIALAQARIKCFPSACQTAHNIELSSTKSEVLESIAKLQAEAGQREEAKNTLFYASQILPSISEGQRFVEGKRINIICTEIVLESIIDNETTKVKFNYLLKFARESGKQRDINLLTIIAALLEMGDIPTALNITDEIEDAWEQVIALWLISKEQYKKQEQVTTLDAILKAKNKIDDEQKQMKSLNVISCVQVLAGLGEQAVRTTEAILTDRNRQLPKIASWLVQTGDHPNFKKILIPCAYYLDAAYEVCESLAQLYPEQAAAVARIISKTS
ncbi:MULTISPECIES: SMEK domain-containing protein [Nostoc]|uniref:ATP-binding protein n=1 Tax=Nostoc paludosum FACHB-159 TaxID=2692908 RepID=A0ABR8KFC7_9NOSO|nr:MULTISPECIES: SMEK domain-containing protein [Nostoc]MBD2680601.1 ATP-binding protein [Nostoc sp. FACHB-857]MBD2736995.1 ATP-binding protein [Nostoc paludosum FACHB-159]